MLPRGVETLKHIRAEPDAFERLLTAKRTLEYLVEPLTRDLKRENGSDAFLSDRLLYLKDRFASVADLMFAMGVRNKLDHPSPAEMPPSDDEIARAAGYLFGAIKVILPHAPLEVAVEVGLKPPPKKRFKCRKCGKKFERQDGLRCHSLTAHRGSKGSNTK